MLREARCSHYFVMTSVKDLAAGSGLRSAHWYTGDDRKAYIHRAWMRRGVPGDAFTGRPQIAVANTASDLTREVKGCHSSQAWGSQQLTIRKSWALFPGRRNMQANRAAIRSPSCKFAHCCIVKV
jgi:hypothetical protein